MTPSHRYTQEAGVRSLERAIGRFLLYKAIKWAAHVDKRDLPPSALPQPFSAFSEASKALVERSKDNDADHNPIVEADKLEKKAGLSHHGGDDHERERLRSRRNWEG